MSHKVKETAAEMAQGGQWRSNVIIPSVSIQAATLGYLFELKVKVRPDRCFLSPCSLSVATAEMMDGLVSRTAVLKVF